jgi:Family of unknown function (DUF6444)
MIVVGVLCWSFGGVGQGVVVPDAPSDEQQLAAENAALRAENAELKRMLAELSDRISELERRLSTDSSNSSRPSCSDALWDTKPARKRSLRTRSGPGLSQDRCVVAVTLGSK